MVTSGARSLKFLADRTNGRAYATVLCPSVCRLSVCIVCNVDKRCVLPKKCPKKQIELNGHVTDDVACPATCLTTLLLANNNDNSLNIVSDAILRVLFYFLFFLGLIPLFTGLFHKISEYLIEKRTRYIMQITRSICIKRKFTTRPSRFSLRMHPFNSSMFCCRPITPMVHMT